MRHPGVALAVHTRHVPQPEPVARLEPRIAESLDALPLSPQHVEALRQTAELSQTEPLAEAKVDDEALPGVGRKLGGMQLGCLERRQRLREGVALGGGGREPREVVHGLGPQLTLAAVRHERGVMRRQLGGVDGFQRRRGLTVQQQAA